MHGLRSCQRCVGHRCGPFPVAGLVLIHVCVGGHVGLLQEFDSIDIDYDEVEVLRSARPRPLLADPHPDHNGKICLILDLDETLVHSSFKVCTLVCPRFVSLSLPLCGFVSPRHFGHQPVPNPDFIIPVEIEGTVHRVYVAKRPGCDEFLFRVSKLYEVVVFTASLAKVGNACMCFCGYHGPHVVVGAAVCKPVVGRVGYPRSYFEPVVP